MKSPKFLIIALLSTFTVTVKVSAQKTTTVDITKVRHTVNRTINMTDAALSPILHINANAGPGLAIIKHRDFKNGEIEFEVKGEDVFQKSFVGFAFHIQNDSTYQAIYFRPFNFKADDALRKKHAVQYISVPDNDWPKLRSSFPLKYEQPLGADVNPADWFKVRIKVAEKLISVYVNGNSKPCLEVVPLGNLNSGKIAFWAGHESAGDFRNLKIKGN
ncbi:hypothetical protein CPT03_08650 [Pedobacter ginsengisoli]|uniref:3-keto-alpha-glucoside-1,2-lyase/3-keto-2-hydroxy-glucal hydratase domain-containing protein n=1 Tax=Pedobacter ginsengisoli TaxID=363852 RepID=A0A2D1U4M6_9SPHI|nr:family 16 glycoside hydrolase [Pedobacter ginsengisoli]ATP56538.1 hypothetical protein CPT03_08650 [Pedobacter ginsengisoli]